jgi:hypothetical protein
MSSNEIPLLLMLFYLLGDIEAGSERSLFLDLRVRCNRWARSRPKTEFDGEFGWGGTSVKR